MMTGTVWPRDVGGARALQEELRKKVRIAPLPRDPNAVAGVDAAFDGDTVIAVASLFTYPDMVWIADASSRRKLRFPYIPGFLSFREGEAVLSAVEKLKIRPDLIILDGQGIAHPRGLGIAAHIGVLLDLPAIGCAKSRLVGYHDEPGQEKGDWEPLRYHERVVGLVLRSRAYVKPLYVSPGHRVDVRSARRIVMGCLTGYRLPEPVRRADQMCKKMKQGGVK